MEEEKLYTIMISPTELTWEGLIRDIVNRENLDPWNIDILILTNKFVDAIKEIKKMDMKLSGKFLLAAAILLKMKADFLIPRLVPEIEEASKETDMSIFEHADAELEPHIPLPKQRKVTLDELIKSLRSALIVKERRTVRYKEREIRMNIKLKKIDIGERIKTMFEKISIFFQSITEIKFSQLIPSKIRDDVIWTFTPLIHLAHQRRIKLRQDEDFGEIYVTRQQEDVTR
jgi:segregation and condensation protein A